MTKKINISLVIIILLIFCAPINADAQQPDEKPVTIFTIDILNAPGFADVNVVQRGLSNSDEVGYIAVSRSSKNYIQLTGETNGNTENFLSDLKGLVQDRFTFESSQTRDGTLAITLRKITSN